MPVMSTASSFTVRFDGALLRLLFDRIYVINLANRTDRRREMEAQLVRIGLSMADPVVQLFPAVRPADRGEFESIGARGCFLSHLGVLKDAVARGCQSILILEDDVDWTPAAIAPGAVQDAICKLDWAFLHGGPGHSPAPRGSAISLQPVAPDNGLMLAHFIALRGGAIELAARYLETMLTRPSGSPDGGPMHVDGAYSWFRKDHPGLAAFVCAPAIAEQRSSRSDISEPKGWRATIAADWARRLLRLIRSRLRRRT